MKIKKRKYKCPGFKNQLQKQISWIYDNVDPRGNSIIFDIYDELVHCYPSNYIKLEDYAYMFYNKTVMTRWKKNKIRIEFIIKHHQNTIFFKDLYLHNLLADWYYDFPEINPLEILEKVCFKYL